MRKARLQKVRSYKFSRKSKVGELSKRFAGNATWPQQLIIVGKPSMAAWMLRTSNA